MPMTLTPERMSPEQLDHVRDVVDNGVFGVTVRMLLAHIAAQDLEITELESKAANKQNDSLGSPLHQQAERQPRSPPKLEALPTYGSHMPWEEFIKSVECGEFNDYDGHAVLATKSQRSKTVVLPSEARYYGRPPWATHVVWFNR